MLPRPMTILTPYRRARLLLLGGVVASFLLYYWASRVMGVPPESGHQASLIVQGAPVASVLVTVVVFAIALAIGTALAGMIRFNAGLLAACLGLAAISLRGGDTRRMWLYAMSVTSANGLFVRFAVEAALLGALIGAAWWVLRGLHIKGTLKDRESESMLDTPEHEAANERAAFGTQLAITAVGIYLLAQSDAKGQALAAVFIASFAGSAVAHTSFSTGPRSWYWLPPIALAFLAYLVCSFSPPENGLTLANPRNHMLIPLVRPLPLDYASLGTAGAILGHWMSRRWQKDRLAMAEQEEPKGPKPRHAPNPE
jgi:hypothetical protein